MSTTNIDVKIFGMTYKFASRSETRKEVLEYAYYLENIIRKEAKKYSSAGFDKLLVLASLNLVESYFLEKNRAEVLSKEIREINREIESALKD